MGKIIVDFTTNRVVAYVGRDGGVYDLPCDDTLIAVCDDPGGKHPFTVFLLRNGIPAINTHVTSIDKLKQDHEVFYMDEKGKTHATN